MFLDNKYSKWYNAIIRKAINQHRKKKQCFYFEYHHIIPRSLGGLNDVDNLVLLSAREHFLCHLLLVKMCGNTGAKAKMACAFNRFKTHHPNSNLYDRFRSAYGTHVRGENNPAFGKVWCHDPITKAVHYIDADELPIRSDLVKGLPEQRGGYKNYRCINNGINDSLISNDDQLPLGWSDGRLWCPPLSHMQKMSSNRHTTAKDDAHSKMMTNRISITKEDQFLKIEESQLGSYLELGWQLTPLVMVPKRFYIFTYQDGSTSTFKNYKSFCAANNLDYVTCKNRGYDTYIKQSIPAILNVECTIKMMPSNPRRSGLL